MDRSASSRSRCRSHSCEIPCGRPFFTKSRRAFRCLSCSALSRAICSRQLPTAGPGPAVKAQCSIGCCRSSMTVRPPEVLDGSNRCATGLRLIVFNRERRAPVTIEHDSTGPDTLRQERAPDLIEQHCLGCHGPEQHMSAFRLDRRSAALRGGRDAIRSGAPPRRRHGGCCRHGAARGQIGLNWRFSTGA